MLPSHVDKEPLIDNSDSSKENNKVLSLGQQYIHIATIVAAYWVVSIVTVFVNKTLLSAQEDFDAPLFVTWYQCVFTVMFCIVMKYLRRRISYFSSFPDITFQGSVMWQILPLSIVFVAMITFNNLCLKYVGVAFYYLARSLTTVTNVIFTFTILHKKVSGRAIGCCLLITAGYFLGIDQEGITGTLTWQGIVYGVLSSCCVSLNSIYTKKVLKWVDDSAWTLCFYNNLNAGLLFIPLMFLTQELPYNLFVVQMLELRFWILMSIGGFCGVSIGIVTALQIQVTSPLTHNISGTAKACVQTIIAVFSYNDIKSWAWWLSNYIVLFGSALYTKVQQMEMERIHKKTKTLPS